MAETKLIQRWETKDEARERALLEHADLVVKVLGVPSLDAVQTHTIAHMQSFPSFIHLLAADPAGKNLTNTAQKERAGMLQAFPKLSAEPLTGRYAVILGNGSPVPPDPFNDEEPTKKEPSYFYTSMVWTAPVKFYSEATGPAVMLGYRLKFANGGGDEEAFIVTPRTAGVLGVGELVDRYNRVQSQVSHEVRRINIWGVADSPEIPKQSWTTWDQIFLEPKAAQAVRDDLMFFVKNEKAFREVEIPYKRGYLIYGPPGNGKSTICRAIATSMPFASFGFDFSNPDWENGDLTAAFRNAAAHAPAAFFLEDIDRVWDEKEGSNNSKVTMDHLLNCIDGIQTNDGLVVVATANNPKVIDPALINRPGRFDAIVELKNPDFELRERYLKFLFRKTDLTAEEIAIVARESEGASMCYVKEIFIQSMRSSIEHSRKVCGLDTEWAVARVMDMFAGAAVIAHRQTGFK